MTKSLAIGAATLAIAVPLGVGVGAASAASTTSFSGSCRTMSCVNSRISSLHSQLAALQAKVASMHGFEHYLYECLAEGPVSEYADTGSATGYALDLNSSDPPNPPYLEFVFDACQSDTSGPAAPARSGSPSASVRLSFHARRLATSADNR